MLTFKEMLLATFKEPSIAATFVGDYLSAYLGLITSYVYVTLSVVMGFIVFFIAQSALIGLILGVVGLIYTTIAMIKYQGKGLRARRIYREYQKHILVEFIMEAIPVTDPRHPNYEKS